MTLWDFLSKIFDVFWPKNGDDKISRIYLLAIIMGLFVWTQKLDFDSYKIRIERLEANLPGINNSLMLITSKMEQNGWFPEYGKYREEFKQRGLNDWYKARTNAIAWFMANHHKYKGSYQEYEMAMMEQIARIMYEMRMESGSDYGEKILQQYEYLAIKTMKEFKIELKSWLRTIYKEESLPIGWEYKIHEIFSRSETRWLKFLKEIQKAMSVSEICLPTPIASHRLEAVGSLIAIERRKKYYVRKEKHGEKIFV